MVTPTRATPLSLRSRRIEASQQQQRAVPRAAPPINVVIDDDFDKTDDGSLPPPPPRRAARVRAPKVHAPSESDDDDDDDATATEKEKLPFVAAAAADDDDDDDETDVDSVSLWRGVRLLCLNLAVPLAALDYRIYLSAASVWLRHKPSDLWERGADQRLRRRNSACGQLLALLVVLALLWSSAAIAVVGPSAALVAILGAAPPAPPIAAAEAPQSRELKDKVDQLVKERSTLDSKLSSKLEALEAELALLRKDNAALLAARHTSGASLDQVEAPTPDAVFEASKAKIELLVRAAIDAERRDLFVTRDGLSQALVTERELLSGAVSKAIGAERAEHAKLHVSEKAAINDRLAALSDADMLRVDDAAVRAIVRELLANTEAKAGAAAADAAQARTAADEALQLAKQQRVSSAPADDAAVRRIVEAYVLGDIVGQPDWALNQAGAVVLPQTSAPFYTPISERTVGDFLALRRAVAMPAEVALSADNTVGNCYAFASVQGTFAVRLAAPIRVTAVSIDHAAASVAFDRGSAPRQFSVLGFSDAQAEGAAIKLGTFQYSLDVDASAVQTFAIASPPADAVRAVVLQIESNHGAKFTCLYRFRVHGERVKI